MSIPNRTVAGDYHYHTYRYAGDAAAGAWQRSLADPQRSYLRFYSLSVDLPQLVVDGLANNVPNLALIQNVGAVINADGNLYDTMALNFGDTTPGVPKIVLTGGIHAREWIAPEITYLIAEYLIKNYSAHPANEYQRQLSQLINTRNIFIVPMLNPAGNAFSMTSAGGVTDWRKNRRLLPAVVGTWAADLNHAPFININPNVAAGTLTYDVPEYPGAARRTVTINTAVAMRGVDCNRNFNTPNWGKETYTATAQNMQQGDPTALLYFGPRQASEVETSNLAGWVAGLGNVAASIDYHSHGQLIILPTEAPVSSQHRRLGEALQLLITWSGSPPYDLGTAMQTVQYAALSSVMDSMAVHRNSRAFTVELDPGRNAGGNPFILPEAQIMRVFEKNIRGALTLIATAGNNPRSFWGGLCCCCSSPWASSVSRFEDWDVVGRGNQLPV